ncbi:MAG TPA: PKD domain-containing protein, partial [Haliscomenobacter sp.]|nr:PKD domain-containing protein [Haliscomenobacter sp.]
LYQNRWVGKLAPGKSTTYLLPPFTAPLGRYIVAVELSNPNGFADARSLNNLIKTYVSINSLPQLPDAAASANNVCFGSETLLKSNYQGDGTVRWFDKNTEGTLLGTGNTLVTGSLTKDTVFFAELFMNNFTGRLNQNSGEVVYNDSIGGLVFDADYDFILKSVTIYPNRTGLRFFTLRNPKGQTQTISYRVSKVGEQKVPLNFKVTRGKDQSLELTRGGELSILKSDFTYPIVVSDVLVIKGANNTEEIEDYPYFFNWEIEYGYPCGRTPVFVDVNPSTARPQAQFTTPNGPLNINTSLNFSDLSSNAIALQWDFGNGQSSTASNPSTIYSKAGAYLVSLNATNAEGCSDVSVKTIQVGSTTSTQEQDELVYRLGIFPNPTQDIVNIEFNLDRNRTIRLSIVNAIGQVLQTENLGERSSGLEQISVQQLPAGAYWLMFDVDGIRVAKPLRVIK